MSCATVCSRTTNCYGAMLFSTISSMDYYVKYCRSLPNVEFEFTLFIEPIDSFDSFDFSY